jgi:phosphoribosylaminoimidazole-succinocarboxamide synthase
LTIDEKRKVFQGSENENLISVSYTDIISLSESKNIRIKNIGKKFSKINSFFFEFLKGYNLPVGYLKISEDENLIFSDHHLFPFSIRILNIVDKRTAKVFGRNETDVLSIPIYELHYGSGKETLVSDDHLIALEVCLVEELKMMFRIASKVNVVLKSFFERRNTSLAEVTCSFGKQDERIFLVNDFSPLSIKIITPGKAAKGLNPYRLSNQEAIERYTDYLLNFTTN